MSQRYTRVLYIWALLLGLSSGYRIEVNNNIIHVGDWDYRSWGDGGQPRCYRMLDKVMEFGVSRVQFVPTQFWVGYDGTYWANRTRVDFYCHKLSVGNCIAFDQQAIDEFREDMRLCFQYAINKGLDIALSPHLDDGLELGGWRNTIRFDPLTQYGGFSYADIMLYPLADALAATATSNTKIWFGMQGEMAATAIFNPRSYQQLIPILKSRIADNGEALYENIKVGLGLNFNKICGCVLLDLEDPTQYLEKFPEAIAPIINTFDLQGLYELFKASDFVGISNYASLKPYFAEPELQNAIRQFDIELSYFNISIREMMLRDGLELHFSEYGVGGSRVDPQYITQEDVARSPWSGVHSPYTQQADPWRMYLDYVSPARTYMHYFYEQTMNMLSKDIQVDINSDSIFLQYYSQYVYRIDAIFIWNQGSWDVQAIYPASSSDEGSYRDEYVVGLIKAHNFLLKST